jgi:hypothetical protein
MIESWNQITISKNYVSEFVNVLNQKHIDYVQDMFNNYIENIPVGIVNEDNTDDIKKFQTLEIQNLNYLNPQFKSEKKMFDFILKKDTISLYNDKLEKIEFNFKKNVKQFAHNVKQFFSNILPKHKLCLTQLFTNTAQAFRGTEIKNIIFLKQIKDFKIILETNLKKYPYKIYITLIDNNNKKISIGNLDLYKNNEFIEGINLKYINSFDYKLDNGEYVLILNLDNSEHKINFKIENE